MIYEHAAEGSKVTEPSRTCDVVISGAGAAGLCAAISAHDAGANVLVLEKGTAADVGGSAWFSGGIFLFAYDALADLDALVDVDHSAVTTEPFPAETYRDVLEWMSDGRAQPDLVDTFVAHSLDAMSWLRDLGVVFRLARGQFGSLLVGTRLSIPAGPVLQTDHAGPGLVQALVVAVRSRDIQIRYATPMRGLLRDGRRVVGVTAGPEHEVITAGSVVLATGGFEADPVLRRQHLGDGWGDVALRGTRLNTGDGHVAALDAGAVRAGDWSTCHAVSLDADAAQPPTHRTPTPQRFSRSFWLGIVVNERGERFFDEGEDWWLRIYSKLGQAIVAQPGARAFHVFDSQHADRVEQANLSVEPVRAGSIAELAAAIGVDPDGLRATVDSFNATCSDVAFDPSRLDGKRADAAPPKSNWATRIERPPFLGYPATCGITFTHGGIRTDAQARVTGQDGAPIQGLYAAGDVTGGLFFGNYPRGSALMRSTVFGRDAGRNAAQSATSA
jgi:tricarballylate dehydrogenase